MNNVEDTTPIYTSVVTDLGDPSGEIDDIIYGEED